MWRSLVSKQFHSRYLGFHTPNCMLVHLRYVKIPAVECDVRRHHPCARGQADRAVQESTWTEHDDLACAVVRDVNVSVLIRGHAVRTVTSIQIRENPRAFQVEHTG